MLTHCFEYLGGIPTELVFDQDRLVTVSENFGDIIYTHEFELFKQKMGFQVYLCRAYDPESKGKVEAVIKYMKNNFAAHRMFTDIQTWNQECLDWLERTANQKVHGTTKKVPAQVFLQEKQYLRPVPYTNKISTQDIITRAVRKDNTILYKSNRYSLPLGTYKPGLEVVIQEENGSLLIFDQATSKQIAQHKLSIGQGNLILASNHLRDHSQKIEELYQNLITILPNNEKLASLLDKIRVKKSRYIRDQFTLAKKILTEYPLRVLEQALDYCLTYKLYSAVDLRDASKHFLEQEVEMLEDTIPAKVTFLESRLKIKTETRDIQAYVKLCGGKDSE